jgi:hypothetical protein
LGKYFVKDKIMHTFPPKCDTKRMGEKIYGTPVKGYEKCKICFKLSFEYENKEKILNDLGIPQKK